MDEVLSKERDRYFDKLGWSGDKSQNDWRGTEVEKFDYKKDL